MAQASNFTDINELARYAQHLYNAAGDLAKIVNSMRYKLDLITSEWHDKQQEYVADVIKEKANIIYDLAEDLDLHSIRVRNYLKQIEENNEILRNQFKV